MTPNIEFHKPENLQTALEILNNEENVKIIAGGTDVVAGFHQNLPRFTKIKSLVDVNDIPELRSIYETDNEILIGAGVSLSEIVKNDLINFYLPVLAKAASQIGSVQIRNRATIAGNFVNNAPCADTVPPLLVYETSLRIQSLETEREITLEDFLLEPYKTQLAENEIVTKIVVPKSGDKSKAEFYKLGRRRGVAISRITLAVLLNLENEIVKDIKIASGAITPIGKRFRNLEEFALNKNYNLELMKKLSVELGKEILNVTGIRWSSTYKVPVVQQTFYQLLNKFK